ncbi:MAG: hypothetical protein CMG74_10485 [Candidatus Marinimicrobia bacterium]|nr:hypothetical protein [Candidatus Neomarinimicrobiota bacterium]|tara:strand:- start:21973 stop:23040 length:1068 start_codon:yes stop_codon:yes gene_type:complete
MKAVILKANKNLSFEKIELDDLNETFCRIKIHNVGLCSSDIARSHDNGAYNYPLIMGHEISGEVEQVGSKIKKYNPGDRVAIFPLLPCFKCEACYREIYAQCHNYNYFGSRCDGGYAEYLDVPEWNMLKLPDSIRFEDAALIEPLSVVVHALKRFNIIDNNSYPIPGSTVIIGAGFLGILAAQILRIKHPNIDLTIIDRNSFKLDVALKYTNQVKHLKNKKDWDDLLNSLNFENVIEATGNPVAFGNSIKLASHGASILWMGNITDDLLLPKDLVSSILRKELSIFGTWNSIYKPHSPDDWKYTLELINSGVKPSELVTDSIYLDEVPNILKKLYDHKTRKNIFNSIKVLVKNTK